MAHLYRYVLLLLYHPALRCATNPDSVTGGKLTVTAEMAPLWFRFYRESDIICSTLSSLLDERCLFTGKDVPGKRLHFLYTTPRLSVCREERGLRIWLMNKMLPSRTWILNQACDLRWREDVRMQADRGHWVGSDWGHCEATCRRRHDHQPLSWWCEC